MKESKVDGTEVLSETVTPRRPKESWYHFIFGYFGTFIIVIPIILARYVEFSPTFRVTLLGVAVPILIGGTWWVVTRGDRYLDEYELATTREMESRAFRLTVSGIIAFELLDIAGMEWDYPRILVFGLLWQLATINVLRRIKRQMQASQPPVRKTTHG